MKAETRMTPPLMAQALDEVVRWREGQADGARARLEEITGEQQRLSEDVAELQRQIATLEGLADRVRQDVAELPKLERARTRAAVDKGLDAEAEVVRSRDSLLRVAQDRRDERVSALLGQPDVARLIEEFEQFQEAEATLNLLPDGYRKAIEAHHQSVRERLRPLMEAAQSPLEPYAEEFVAVSVIGSISPPQGQVEALAVLLPVPFAVFEEGAERGEDLACLLAYRLIAVIGATLAEVGQPDATVQYADYRGLLAIQVWFGDDSPRSDLREAFTSQLDRAREQSTELAAAGIEIYTIWLDPEVIAGTEDEGDPETHVDAPAIGGGPMDDETPQVEA